MKVDIVLESGQLGSDFKRVTNWRGMRTGLILTKRMTGANRANSTSCSPQCNLTLVISLPCLCEPQVPHERDPKFAMSTMVIKDCNQDWFQKTIPDLNRQLRPTLSRVKALLAANWTSNEMPILHIGWDMKSTCFKKVIHQ